MNRIIKILFVIFISGSLSNCTNSKSNKAASEQVVVEVPKVLTLTVKLKTTEEDKFSFLVNNIKVDELQKMNMSAFETIPPSTELETFKATFFEDVISNVIILDLGNKKVKNVEIGSIEISYGKNSIIAAEENILDYFNLNKFVSYDSETNLFITKKVDGQHFPRLILKPKGINSLKK